jgi:16S rRNA (cytosine967-C5)-methyltransferase
LPTGSLRLETQAQIASLEGYETGDFQVQDAASALPARLLRIKSGDKVLDLCAAPGGKTAQLAKFGAKVVAVEKSAPRLARLRENLARLRLEAECVVADAGSFERNGFDAVLLDAPCSATGTIRRHPEIGYTKRLEDILALARQQERLLAHAIGRVKAGGILVYATCSLEFEEGERQIARLLEANPQIKRLPIQAREAGVLAEMISVEGDLRVLPSHLAQFGGVDGFYAARVQVGA